MRIRGKNVVLLATTLCLLMTGCGNNAGGHTPGTSAAENQETEQATETETAEITSETTTAATTEATTEEVASPKDAKKEKKDLPDDPRFKAYFDTMYKDLADRFYLTTNNIDVKYAYVDLDEDGTNEMLIGDGEGVYVIVTEKDGEFYESEVEGWRVQYGAEPTPYLGGGCFATSLYNGNNYGGPFREDQLLKYTSSLNGCGVLARLTSSWATDNSEGEQNCWDLYMANDPNNIIKNVSEDYSLYSHDFIDYGKNYTFDEEGNVEKNELMIKFEKEVEAHKDENASKNIEWMDVE